MAEEIDMRMYQDRDGRYVLTINNTVYQPMSMQEALDVMSNAWKASMLDSKT